jgi:hypothetical protein
VYVVVFRSPFTGAAEALGSETAVEKAKVFGT